VIGAWQPPLNIAKNPHPLAKLKLARKTMADDARAWAKSNGQQAEGGYGPQSCLICTREQLAAPDTEPPAIRRSVHSRLLAHEALR
jgi:hypothetical protein